LVDHNLSSKESSVSEPACVCANRFYEYIEDQKTAVSEYLEKRFGRWKMVIYADT
jgi:hypothetical protein